MSKTYTAHPVTLAEAAYDALQLAHLLSAVQTALPSPTQFATLLDDLCAHVEPAIVFEFVNAAVLHQRELSLTPAFKHYVKSEFVTAQLRRELNSRAYIQPAKLSKPSVRKS